ncbi:MAG: phytoene desaturase family protein [Longimicrobiales bacterium]
MRFDAIVVGAGPNGLAAAVTLAQAGWSVEVREAKDTIGGGARTEALTLPGFLHDVCSAVHPTAAMSPFLRSLDLEADGLDWAHAPLPLAHPLDDGTAAFLDRSIAATADGLGEDAHAYAAVIAPFVTRWHDLADEIFQPIRLPRRPLLMARFGLEALRSADSFATRTFRSERARALFAGLAAHGIVPLEYAATASFGLVLAIAAHAVGWPIARRGSQAITHALAARLVRLGGTITTGAPVSYLAELPSARAILLDLTPAQFIRIAGAHLPSAYRRSLEAFRYGPGVFKVDWALSGPVPWTAEACRNAMVVHAGGTIAEVAQAERDVWNGRVPDRPFVLVAQPSLVDPSRAPDGQHTAWAYCHVPHASTSDMTDRIENQIERFAPGFRARILAKNTLDPGALERRNANYIGGDITGGASTLRQLIFRPTGRLVSYQTPLRGVYFCSSSSPPGAGVHGMCGYNAARRVLRDATRRTVAWTQRATSSSAAAARV